jgi:uncharacterized protein YyaL (SSP411 family)
LTGFVRVSAADAAAPPAAVEEPDGSGPLGAALQGIDLDLPAQDAFAAWPGPELTGRVYWLPWGPFAFQRAKLFDRPVLLVLTVGWARLSERLDAETFTDRDVLQALHAGYITIRADADRRPDLRERYHSGAWPDVALLLPDGRPILSQANATGMALPITAGYLGPRRMQFLLDEGSIYYQRWAGLLRSVGNEWAKIEAGPDPPRGPVDLDASNRLAVWLAGNADHGSGGFGAAPKLVIPGLSEYAAIRADHGDDALAEHAHETLAKLAASPLYDAREGGVHRAAALPGWEGIQYEKLAAQNAAFVRELDIALRRGPSEDLLRALRGTASYLGGVLANPKGGFHVAQPPDSASADGGAYWRAADGTPAQAPAKLKLVLAGDSALAGAALLRAAARLDDASLAATGRRALERVLAEGYANGRGVDHVLEPRPEPRRFLATQADVAFALLDAYATTGEERYRAAALDLAQWSLSSFSVPGETALRDLPAEPAPIGLLANPRRPMPENARMARVLLRLAAMGASGDYEARARTILGTYAGDLAAFGVAGIEAALALEEALREPLRIRIDGPPQGEKARALRAATARLPDAWIVVRNGDERAKPAAQLQYGARSARVTKPQDLAGEVAQLRRLGAGASP